MTLLAYLDVVLTVLPRYLRLALIGRVQAGLVRSAITALIAKRGANNIRPLARAILSGMLHSAEQIVSFAIWTRARSLCGLPTWRIPLPPIHDASTAPGITALLKRLAALQHCLDALDAHARRLAAKWKRADACPLRLDAAHRHGRPSRCCASIHIPRLRRRKTSHAATVFLPRAQRGGGGWRARARQTVGAARPAHRSASLSVKHENPAPAPG